MAISGVLHGAREAYHADPYVFERGFGVAPSSFWGSDAWKRNYFQNNPTNGHKTEIFGNVGRDFWHTSNFLEKGLTFSASFWIGCRKKTTTQKIMNMLVAVAVRSVASTATYQIVRNF